MARDPKERYGSCLELAEDVEHWLADEPLTADRVPDRDKITPPVLHPAAGKINPVLAADAAADVQG